ncbi:MAG: hypothetical protein LBP92_03530 [Deltaproteobacteria bacterium]|jgi:hypothetical protein|nr:hypothetical protein [Deltaproteobacteria bacterium]
MKMMDTQIFNLKLSVNATSAYILICALVGDGVPASDEAVSARWNAPAGELDAALAELQIWRVIERRPGPEGVPAFSPNPASLWRQPSAA